MFCFDLLLLLFSSLIYRPNDSRREIWIKNSGNDELRSVSATQRRLFCEDHFDPKYLRCQFNRTTLRRDAVPYPCDEVPEAQEEVGEYIRVETQFFQLMIIR